MHAGCEGLAPRRLLQLERTVWVSRDMWLSHVTSHTSHVTLQRGAHAARLQPWA